MKTNCEKCLAELKPGDLAYICSYECTYCEKCSTQMDHICPNCKGELVKRPRRVKS